MYWKHRAKAAEEKLEKLAALEPEHLNTSEVVLVELKTPRGRLSSPQERVIAKLRGAGIAVYVIDDNQTVAVAGCNDRV